MSESIVRNTDDLQILSIGQTFAEYKAMTSWGWDLHIWDILPTRLEYGRLSVWLIELSFLLNNAVCKISILLVYRQISARSQNRLFIKLTWAAIGFTIYYMVGFLLELFFVCRPLVSYWKSYNPTYKDKYTCGSEQAPVVAQAAVSVFSDVYASVLPVLLVRKLQITRRQRIGMYALFSGGLLTAAVGCGRLYYLVKITTKYQIGPDTHDVTWYGWPCFVSVLTPNAELKANRFKALTDLEAHLAMICASLPALKALYKRKAKSRASYGSRHPPMVQSGRPSHRRIELLPPMAIEPWNTACIEAHAWPAKAMRPVNIPSSVKKPGMSINPKLPIKPARIATPFSTCNCALCVSTTGPAAVKRMDSMQERMLNTQNKMPGMAGEPTT
jgi:hypothetical protein